MIVAPLFRDRGEAGRALAVRLARKGFPPGILILALPRGGIPVGFEIQQSLGGDLDVFLVRKLGVPGQEELAMGAIASGGIRVLNPHLIQNLGISPAAIHHAIAVARQEIERHERLYRYGRPALPIRGRDILLVDDGLATGATMLAAAHAVRAKQPKRVIVAVPVASQEAYAQFHDHVDDVVFVATPTPFHSVGTWYGDFSQVSDAEVQALLDRAAHKRVA